jgi:hypothetical protein
MVIVLSNSACAMGFIFGAGGPPVKTPAGVAGVAPGGPEVGRGLARRPPRGGPRPTMIKHYVCAIAL